MLTVSVCYSNRSGQEFASCTLGGVELGPELLDQPAVLAAAIKTAYARCVDAVNTQLGGPAATDKPPAVSPVQAPAVKPAPSTPPPVTPPPTGNQHYYGDRRPAGRGTDGPPTTGPQLGGWAKKLGAIPWFEDLGRKQVPALPKLLSEWPSEWAVWAYAQYQAACIPPVSVPVTNGVATH
ncbi:MAG: hypothetical protein ACHRXM_26410 [Isosphaerales bacterium]